VVEPVIIGKAALYLGSCEDILPHLPRVDAVVTDPPYGIGEARGRSASSFRPGRWNKPVKPQYEGGGDWDDAPICSEVMAQVRRAGRWQIIFGGNYYDCPAAKCWLVWDKVTGESHLADCELAWTNLDKAVRLIRYLWNGFQREKGAQRGDHPTQKPLEVMKWAIGHIPAPCETILDPFAGSGTTGVAAIQMGKSFIGIEREPKYFEAMCRRIREANGDDAGPLFGEQAA
jgi:site-specific DNA-methyltransferase (adenine-specific)/modification methylase